MGVLQDMRHFGGALLDKGVREVSIIGDSHLRAFMCSVEYMAGGEGACNEGRFLRKRVRS